MASQRKQETDSESSDSANGIEGDQTSLPDAIKTTAIAINLCLSNKFGKAQAKLEPWAKESMYHALGYGTIMYLQAIMTFEPQAIEQACNSIKTALEVCQRQRHKNSWSESLSSWIWNPSYESLTEEERHAELCYAECLLQRALLTFIQDENLISFIKGALKIRACYQSYKTCMHMVKRKPLEKHDLPQRKDFEGGVHLGIGTFNLLLSLLPAKLLKILEWVGFSGDKDSGLEHLDIGCRAESLRSPMCAMMLLAYHCLITYYLGIGDGDVDYAEEILEPFIKAFPKGAIFLYYAGRIKQVQGKLDEAEERYNYSIRVQSEWKQFHHICYWELMWCYSFQCNWAKAFHYAAVLLKESRWSKTSYMYLKASFKFMARITNQPIDKEDDTSEEDGEEYMFRHLPDFKQRIAGKSIPFEKYCIHKANRYFKHENWLFLPGLELIHMWNGFRQLRRRPDLIKPLLALVQQSLEHVEQNNDKDYYYDDWCLGKILEGMCYQHIGQFQQALDCLHAAVERSKFAAFDNHLGAYASAEVGFVYMEQGNNDLAKKYLNTARKDHQGYMMENRLHFRIHAALDELKAIKKKQKAMKKRASKRANNNDEPTTSQESSEVGEDAGSDYGTASEGEGSEDEFVEADDALETLAGASVLAPSTSRGVAEKLHDSVTSRNVTSDQAQSSIVRSETSV